MITMARKFVHHCAFMQSFLCVKLFFLNEGYFYPKGLSKLFKDFCGKFKDFSRISHNFSIFKARANHVLLSALPSELARKSMIITIILDKVPV